MSKRKIRPEVFVRAARRIEAGDNRYCCFALNHASSNEIENDFFKSLYRPKNAPVFARWFGHHYVKGNQAKRVAALLRTARLARAKGPHSKVQRFLRGYQG